MICIDAVSYNIQVILDQNINWKVHNNLKGFFDIHDSFRLLDETCTYKPRIKTVQYMDIANFIEEYDYKIGSWFCKYKGTQKMC